MLTRSFIFARGMTEELERGLWSRGVIDWDILRRHRGEAVEVLGEARSQRLVQAVNEADQARTAKDLAWFRTQWPEREMWRLWQGWCEDDECALVDIETTGRTPGYDQITVIGLSDGSREEAFVADKPQPGDQALAAFPAAIRRFALLVTFNGLGFDVPFIEKHYRAQGFRFEQPHLDLLPVARSVGLTGGLKDMEQQLGIVRDDDIADMRGHEAIALWGAWKAGDLNAYQRLVTYCKADCTNLRAFADQVYRRKVAAVYTPYAQDIDLDQAKGQQLSLF